MRCAVVTHNPRAPRGSTSWVLLLVLTCVALLPIGALLLTAFRPALRYPALWTEQMPPASTGYATLKSSFLATLFVPSMVHALATSLVLAALTGLGATFFAFVAARVLNRASPAIRRIAAGAAFLPVIAPPIALGVGVQVFALQLGIGATFSGVFAAHLVPAIGYLTLFLLGVFTAYDLTVEETARSLGASPWTVITRITLPILKWRIVEAITLGAIVSWGQLGLTLLVGGGVIRTLPVELLAFVRSGDDRLGAAAALLLSLPPLAAIGLMQHGARRTGVVT